MRRLLDAFIHYLPVTLIVLVGISFVLWNEARHLQTQEDHEATHARLTQETAELRDQLIAERERSESLREDLGQLDNQLGTIIQEYGDVSSSVDELRRLTTTDPELLQKYSKVFFLNEHYQPERLVEIPEEYRYHEDRTERIHAQVWPYLEDLLEAAWDDDIELYIKSGYRSFEEQRATKTAYTIQYGAGTANTFSAEQGYSEHQLGTTVDFITTGINGTLPGFDDTDAYAWLLDNAHEYGFVLSYPENNEYYIFEPWHWRFVGTALSQDLFEDDQLFYDLNQRAIDEYLPTLFE